jgi:hypothetical protein
MTTGVLIFAFNNEQIDYVQLAAWSAQNIRRHLGIPVAVITNDADRSRSNNWFDVVIPSHPASGGIRNFSDCAGPATWYNAGRVDAYDASPWDQTLLLDADYVVASNTLQTVLSSDQEFLAHNRAQDVTGENNFQGLNYFGAHSMPMSWATVVMFRKGLYSKMIFDAMKMIRAHWPHYCKLYQIGNSVYRNDHAMSIALGIVNGHTLDYPSITWPLMSLLPDHNLDLLALDHYRVDYTTSTNQRRWIDIKEQDFHAMGKRHLGDIVAKNFA